MAAFTGAVAESGGRASADFRYRHADGSWIPLRGRARNLLDDPVVEGVVVYVHEAPSAASVDAGGATKRERPET